MARILVVDDSRLARTALRRVLEGAGHQVTEAADAEAALALMVGSVFDLVSTDVLMPHLDGRAFLDALADRGSAPPVIVVTADVQKSTVEECLRRGAAAVVNKPFTTEALLATVKAALASRKDAVRVPVLDDQQKGDLAEVVNIGVGHAASALNDLTGLHVELTVPEIDVVSVPGLARTLGGLVEDSVSSVQMGFRGGLEGCAFLVFPPSSAAKLATLVTGEPAVIPSVGLHSGTLTEVGNILINSVVGAIANLLDLPLRYSLPVYAEERVMDLLDAHRSEAYPVVLVAKARFEIRQSQVEGNLLLLFEMSSFEGLLRALARRGGGR
jgi:chemotaxis protein CheC